MKQTALAEPPVAMTRGTQGMLSKDVEHCRYDGSKLLWRGPMRDLVDPFVACLGGTDTFGAYLAQPYPDLLERNIGVACVNFGVPNAGIDVFRRDAALMDCVNRSEVCVLQVPNAINMTNLYYRVHPRRNDRVLQVTEAMRALFPSVDFTPFNFTRHMLIWLRNHHPGEFGYVRQELETIWVSEMTTMLEQIDVPILLLWLSSRSPDAMFDRPELAAEPALVTRAMLDRVQHKCQGFVEVLTPPPTHEPDRDAITPAKTMPSAKTHAQIAQQLGQSVLQHLKMRKAHHAGGPFRMS